MYKILFKGRGRLLSLMLVVLFMAGCGAANNNPTASSSTTETSKLEPVTLTWYMRGNGPEKDDALVYKEASNYLKPLINASIEIITIDRGSYVQKVTASIASGETFDMCFTTSYAVNYMQNALKGAYVPLNDPKNNLFEKYAPKTLALLGTDFLSGSSINGLNYAIPVNKEKAHSYGYVLRKDIIDKYNLDISNVKTVADLEPLLKVVKEKEPTMNYPLSAVARDNPAVTLDWARSSIDTNLPVSMYGDNRDKKYHFDLEMPEEMAYFKLVHKFYQAGYIRQDAATVTDYTPDLQAGKIFAKEIVTKPGGAEEMTQQLGVPWVQIEMTKPAMTNDETMGAMTAISRTSKNPERCMMFQELMNTDRYLNNLINFGIEGVHYVKKDANTIDYLPDSNNGKDSKYNPQMSWGFANQFITYLFPNESPDKWKNYEVYNNSARKIYSLGFLMNQDPVKNEIAACINVVSEFMPGLETGASDPEVILPKAIAKFKDAGIDKIVQEAQKQFDAWDAIKK